MGLVAFVLNVRSISSFSDALLAYFACEAAGVSASRDCGSEKKAYQSLNHFGTSILSYVLLGLLPTVSLLYVIQFGELKQHCVSCLKCQRSLLLRAGK